MAFPQHDFTSRMAGGVPSGDIDALFMVYYNVTTAAEIDAALTDNKVPYFDYGGNIAQLWKAAPNKYTFRTTSTRLVEGENILDIVDYIVNGSVWSTATKTISGGSSSQQAYLAKVASSINFDTTGLSGLQPVMTINDVPSDGVYQVSVMLAITPKSVNPTKSDLVFGFYGSDGTGMPDHTFHAVVDDSQTFAQQLSFSTTLNLKAGTNSLKISCDGLNTEYLVFVDNLTVAQLVNGVYHNGDTFEEVNDLTEASNFNADDELLVVSPNSKRKMLWTTLANKVLGFTKKLSTTITAFRTGDVIPVDGPSGTAKMSKDGLLKETAQNTLEGNVAPPFSELNTYAVGDYCIYQGKFYKFTAIHSGAWDDDDVSRVTVKGQFATKPDVNPSATMTIRNMQSLFGYKTGDVPAKLPTIYFERGFTNMDVEFPLDDGYYTLDTAISAIPVSLRAKGHIIAFRPESNRWLVYMYHGDENNDIRVTSEDGWLNVKAWELVFDSKFDKVSDANDLMKCFNSIGLEGSDVDIVDTSFVAGSVTFPDASDTTNARYAKTGFIRASAGSVVSLANTNFSFAVAEFGDKQNNITTQTATEAYATKMQWVCTNPLTRYIRVVAAKLGASVTPPAEAKQALVIKSVISKNKNIPAINVKYTTRWYIGSVNYTTGLYDNRTDRIATYRIPAGERTIVHLSNQESYKFMVYAYTHNTNAVGYLGPVGRTGFGVDDIVVDKNCGGIVVVLAKNDGSTFDDTSDGSVIDVYVDKQTAPIEKAMPCAPYGWYTSTTPVHNVTSTPSYSELIEFYESLRSDYPDYVSRTNLGKDQSGTYDIYEYKFAPKMAPIGSNPVGISYSKDLYPTILLVAGVHGHEYPMQTALANMMSAICSSWLQDDRLEYLRNNFILLVIPCANPWGAENGVRGNSRGVDINRNFDCGGTWATHGSDDPLDERYKGESAFSEAETQILRDWILAHQDFKLFVDYHTFGVFTSYMEMCCWDTCNLHNTDRKLLSFIEMSNKLTASGWRSHNLPSNSGLLGTINAADPGSAIGSYAEYATGMPSVTMEGMYRYYDGNIGPSWTTDVNNMNIEVAINSVLVLIKNLYYDHKS